jgi:hypothetical protein
MPEGYDVRAWTANEAIKFLDTGEVTVISFDHDLGHPDDGTGYEVACYIEARAFHAKIPRLVWHVHSDNPVGRENIKRAMGNAEYYWLAASA